MKKPAALSLVEIYYIWIIEQRISKYFSLCVSSVTGGFSQSQSQICSTKLDSVQPYTENGSENGTGDHHFELV